MSNYDLQQYFLNWIKEFALYNPDREINRNFVYSLLERFNMKNDQFPGMDIGYNFEYWQNRYKNNSNIDVFVYQDRPFLWFQNGTINGNEIKLYVPLDSNHIKEGANLLFDFISSKNIIHQSKIAKVIRTDNVVIRVTTLEDADTILKYVTNNPYLMQGLMKVNPFLPNYNGIGVTMDNFTTYNGNVAQIISDFYNYCKSNHVIEQFNVEGLNKYIKFCITREADPDIRDIFDLLSKVIRPNFKFAEFAEFAKNKIPDKYDSNQKRIIDPKFYFEEAIKITEKNLPGNSKDAILRYLKGDSTAFTRKNQARFGLIKYVDPADLINLMRSKLTDNNIPIPRTDSELIDKYLNILLHNDIKKEQYNSFDIIKNAYINTSNVYNRVQARAAINNLIINGEINFFTNRFGDRTKLKTILNQDIIKIILSNIDINDLDVDNVSEIINRFESLIKETINERQRVSSNL